MENGVSARPLRYDREAFTAETTAAARIASETPKQRYQIISLHTISHILEAWEDLGAEILSL